MTGTECSRSLRTCRIVCDVLAIIGFFSHWLRVLTAQIIYHFWIVTDWADVRYCTPALPQGRAPGIAAGRSDLCAHSGHPTRRCRPRGYFAPDPAPEVPRRALAQGARSIRDAILETWPPRGLRGPAPVVPAVVARDMFRGLRRPGSRSISTGASTSRERPDARHYGYTHRERAE